MNESKRGSSHAMIWTLVVIVCLPVLYVLSVPPVVQYSKVASSVSVQHLVRVSQHGYLRPVSSAVYHYYLPYEWLRQHTVLSGALTSYMAWWLPPIVIRRS